MMTFIKFKSEKRTILFNFNQVIHIAILEDEVRLALSSGDVFTVSKTPALIQFLEDEAGNFRDVFQVHEIA